LGVGVMDDAILKVFNDQNEDFKNWSKRKNAHKAPTTSTSRFTIILPLLSKNAIIVMIWLSGIDCRFYPGV
jgi:hypothetical protein